VSHQKDLYEEKSKGDKTMGQLHLSELDLDKVNKVKEKVENHSNAIMDIVNSIITPYCSSLDNYVAFIGDCLKDGETPPTNDELDDFCMNLSTLIYFAGGMCEQLGIKDDISKAVYKEVYHSARAVQEGTVADKDSLAELEAQQEQLTNICYNRAYKIMKSKIDNAQELLGSCKKVLSRRMAELELTRIQR
jgi:hypothetical protein